MIKDVSDENFEIIEVYPYVYVYKNLFKNIDEIYSMLKDSHEPNQDQFFNNWSQWSIFGEYLNPVVATMPDGLYYDPAQRYANFDKCEVHNDLQKKQKDFLMQLFDNFYAATEHYAKKHGVHIDKETMITNEHGFPSPLWRMTGPTICRYHISDEANRVGMRYHSDFIREQTDRPGYQFAITALTYFNDDYKGGELDFVIDKKLVMYKPQAGDLVVFPSGHPDILTEDGQVYLHGVMPSEGTHKYFARMYWQKFNEGTPQWFEKEKEFGREAWLAMQDKLEEEYRQKHPQRHEIEGGIRIQ